MKEVKAEILTIGDEILFGQTLDTNAHWISEHLQGIGVRVIRRTTVGDSEDDILDALRHALAQVDIVLITGGLGPTNDDLTKPALARFFDSPIQPNMQALSELEAYMSSRGRELNILTRKQAELPLACEMISNPRGTAAGMWFDRDGKVVVSMPGIPHEMRDMMTRSVIPRIGQRFQLPHIYHKIVRTAGIGESWLAEKIEAWERALPPHIRLAYLPSFGDIKMRLTATGPDIEKLRREADEQVASLRPFISDYIYGYDADELPKVIGNLLMEKGWTMAVAESCTGGYISHSITAVPGSSRYYRGGVVAYHNEVKTQELGVSAALLEQFGAVSGEVVQAMAVGVRSKLGADVGLSTSGIAGPEGGTPDKPVGTIWIGYADAHGSAAKKVQFVKDRYVNIRLTNVAALNLLRQRLAGKDWE
jgi:nicotinamide-nucleotide amidase